MAGRGGGLEISAGDRWDKSHEGTGGMISIGVTGDEVAIVQDFNCGGMFRAWTEEDGYHECRVFRKDSWESGPECWHDVRR
jgi:L-asparaginase